MFIASPSIRGSRFVLVLIDHHLHARNCNRFSSLVFSAAITWNFHNISLFRSRLRYGLICVNPGTVQHEMCRDYSFGVQLVEITVFRVLI